MRSPIPRVPVTRAAPVISSGVQSSLSIWARSTPPLQILRVSDYALSHPFPHLWGKMSDPRAILTPPSQSKQTTYNFSLRAKVLLC